MGTRYARFYSFTLTERPAVTIALESETGPYIFLLDDDGNVVAENDDIDTSGDNYNSRIELTLDVGDYTIEATNYSREATGDFALTYSGLPADGEARPTPAPTPNACVEAVSGTGTSDGSWNSACASEGRSGSHASYYTFILTGTAKVTVMAESELKTFLFLREGSGRDGNAHIAPAAEIKTGRNINVRPKGRGWVKSNPAKTH